MNTDTEAIKAADYRYHFFISHASEERERWAKPLAVELVELGCSVWIDNEQMDAGQNVVEEINKGLRESKYFVPIISNHWIKKKWTRAEGSAAFISHHGRVLPLRHQLTQSELEYQLPLYAVILNFSTDLSVRKLAASLVRAISEPEERKGALTSVDLRKLAKTAPPPNSVDALNYIRTVGSQNGETAAIHTSRHRSWPLILAFCIAAAAVAAASVSPRLNPVLQRARSQVTSLQSDVNRWKKQTLEQRSSLDELEIQVKEMTRSVKASKADLQRLRAELDAANEHAGTLKAENNKLSADNADISGRFAAADRENTSLQERLLKGDLTAKEIAAERERLKKKSDEDNAHLDRADQLMRDMIKELEAAGTENTRLQKQVSEREQQFLTSQRNIQNAQAQVTRLKAKVDALQSRGMGAKLVRVQGSGNVNIQDDDRATLEPEAVPNSVTRWTVTKPPGSELLLLLVDPCTSCVTFTAPYPEEVQAAVPARLW